MRVLPLIVWAAAVSLLVHAETGKRDFTVYRDETYGFELIYPKSWIIIPPRMGDTRVKVANSDRKSLEDCVVQTNTAAYYEKYDPQKFVAEMMRQQEKVVAGMQARFPGIVLQEGGKTYFGNDAAHYLVFDLPPMDQGSQVRITTIQVRTAKNGTRYTVSCGAPQTRFNKLRPMYNAIVKGFRIGPPAP